MPKAGVPKNDALQKRLAALERDIGESLKVLFPKATSTRETVIPRNPNRK